MALVDERLKPEPGLCLCGCGKIGRLQTRKRKDGNYHVQRCPCLRCKGARTRDKGQRAQSRAAKALGVPRAGSVFPSHEEAFGGLVRVESKAGAQVKPMFTAFAKAEKQSEVARNIGDNRPFVMAARLEPHSKDGLIAFREKQLRETVYALAVQLGLIDDGHAV